MDSKLNVFGMDLDQTCKDPLNPLSCVLQLLFSWILLEFSKIDVPSLILGDLYSWTSSFDVSVIFTTWSALVAQWFTRLSLNQEVLGSRPRLIQAAPSWCDLGTWFPNRLGCDNNLNEVQSSPPKPRFQQPIRCFLSCVILLISECNGGAVDIELIPEPRGSCFEIWSWYRRRPRGVAWERSPEQTRLC